MPDEAKPDLTEGGKFPARWKERRTSAPFVAEQAKFSTQREVTYVLLVVFAGVVLQVILFSADQSERSIILQTVINLTILAVGYWLGSSKAAAEQGNAISRIAEKAPEDVKAAVAAARAPALVEAPKPAEPPPAVTPGVATEKQEAAGVVPAAAVSEESKPK